MPDVSGAAVVDVQVLRERLKQMFSMPDLLPDNLLSYLLDYNSVNQPQISASTITGLTTSSSSVAGSVGSTGTITQGSGFSVVHSGTGVYAVTFTTAFSAAPVVVVTPVTSGSRFAGVSTQSASGFTAQLANLAGTATDQAFNFIASDVS